MHLDNCGDLDAAAEAQTRYAYASQRGSDLIPRVNSGALPVGKGSRASFRSQARASHRQPNSVRTSARGARQSLELDAQSLESAWPRARQASGLEQSFATHNKR